MSNTRLWRIAKLVVAVGLVICVITVVLLVMDFQNARVVYSDLRWHILPVIIVLAFIDHALRFLRWHLLLNRVSGSSRSTGTSAVVFLSGSLLILTPARVGEVAKSIFARDSFGIPVAMSLPIIVMEKAVDVAVMALLSSTGLLIIGETSHLIVASIILAVVVVLIAFSKPLIRFVSRFASRRLAPGTIVQDTLESFERSQAALTSPPLLSLNFLLGICAWTIEVTIYFLSLYFVGVAMSNSLFLLAMAVFPLASLFGSISFLPGGIGATEGALIGLTVAWAQSSLEEVVFATLLSRIAILGAVVVSGVVALLIMWHGRRSRRSD